ncbi:hypothetical protein GSI_08686 [Ganoderma sinense ZZ0214-1]|uniref:BTB domain-containing protein n=1 Tax=Ganoderma sinense ZZ0214-1 TaxID=1077348 RepID=A0A2G8S4I7_9APHY|nr:hypothetical protein GSI_08686 [Ganoderma sinense ZZ0214-1]
MNPNAVSERHPDLYFPDGDVILAVKQTPHSGAVEPPKYTLFRVHKFLLKHHSTTFANFFADANVAPAEVYDGVPLAEMFGDRAEDFAVLLDYLYNPTSLVFKRNDPNIPLTVSGVIRLSDKYLIEPLRRRLVQEVCAAWPTTLVEYDIKQAEIDSLRALPLNAPLKYRGRLADVIPEPASAILFAQEFDCPQILPAAFYTLSLIPITHDWDAKPRECHEPLAKWSLLDNENLVRYIHGFQSLNKYRPHPIQFLCEHCDVSWNMDGPAEPVNNSSYDYIKRLLDVVWDGAGPSVTHSDPIRLLAKCFNYYDMPELSEKHFPDGLCEGCDRLLSRRLPEERKRLWENLGEWFKVK